NDAGGGEGLVRMRSCGIPTKGSIDALQRIGFALFDRDIGAAATLVLEQFARQAVLPDLRVRVRRLGARQAGIGQAVLGPPQPGVGSLLAGFARPRALEHLPRLLIGALLLRPRGAGLRRA